MSYYRQHDHPNTHTNFTLQSETLSVVSSLTYLGCEFYYTGKLSHVSESMLIPLRKHINMYNSQYLMHRHAVGLPLSVLHLNATLQSFEYAIEFIFSWSKTTFTKADKLIASAIRPLLRLYWQSSTMIALADFGKLPTKFRHMQLALWYLYHIGSFPQGHLLLELFHTRTDLLARCARTNLLKGYSFVKYITDLVYDLGLLQRTGRPFIPAIRTEYRSLTSWKCAVDQRVCARFEAHLASLCQQDDGGRTHTYSLIRQPFTVERLGSGTISRLCHKPHNNLVANCVASMRLVFCSFQMLFSMNDTKCFCLLSPHLGRLSVQFVHLSFRLRLLF